MFLPEGKEDKQRPDLIIGYSRLNSPCSILSRLVETGTQKKKLITIAISLSSKFLTVSTLRLTNQTENINFEKLY